MPASSEWTIEFLIEADGSSPVEEFLDGVDIKTRARFAWSMEQLRVRNIHAREPLVRHLDDDLWELREESSTNIYRIIYFFFTGRRIILVHGFQKKTQRTPGRELETARRRRAAFVAREQGKAEGRP